MNNWEVLKNGGSGFKVEEEPGGIKKLSDCTTDVKGKLYNIVGSVPCPNPYKIQYNKLDLYTFWSKFQGIGGYVMTGKKFTGTLF